MKLDLVLASRNLGWNLNNDFEPQASCFIYLVKTLTMYHEEFGLIRGLIPLGLDFMIKKLSALEQSQVVSLGH